MVFSLQDLYTWDTFTWEDNVAIFLYAVAWYITIFSFSRLYILDVKKLSCVITLANSFLMTLIGFMHIIASMVIGLNIFSPVVEQEDMIILFFSGRSNFTSSICSIIAAANAMDLIFGFLFYRKYLKFLTSYVHHVTKIWIMYYAITGNGIVFSASSAFANALMWLLIEELPTFIAAFGTIFPSFRSDIGFGLTLFMSRVVLHSHLLLQIIMKFAAGVCPLIVKWYYSILLFINLKVLYNWCAQLGKATRKKRKG